MEKEKPLNYYDSVCEKPWHGSAASSAENSARSSKDKNSLAAKFVAAGKAAVMPETAAEALETFPKAQHFYWVDKNDSSCYYERTMSTWDLVSLYDLYGYKCTAAELYSYFLSLPTLKESRQRGSGSLKMYKEMRRAEYEDIKSKAKCWMEAHGISVPTDAESYRLCT